MKKLLLFLALAPMILSAQVSSFDQIKRTDPELYKYVYAMHKKHKGEPWRVTFATPKADLFILRAPKIDGVIYDSFESVTAMAYEDGRVFVKVKPRDGLTSYGLEFAVFQIGVTSEEWSAYKKTEAEYFSKDVGIYFNFMGQFISYSPSKYGMGLEEYLTVVERQFGQH